MHKLDGSALDGLWSALTRSAPGQLTASRAGCQGRSKVRVLRVRAMSVGIVAELYVYDGC